MTNQIPSASSAADFGSSKSTSVDAVPNMDKSSSVRRKNIDSNGLQQTNQIEQAESSLNAEADHSEPERYGCTPSGKVFLLPKEQENRRSILETVDPRFSKTPWDWIVISSILAQVLLFFMTTGAVRRYSMMLCFFFWRISYDAGIGFLLHMQSNHRKVVTWISDFGFFDKENHPKLYDLTKKQLISKMDSSYNYDTSPLEFNSWLVFRHFVDLILMCDFCSYILMGLAWTCWPKVNIILQFLRIFGGIALIVFNYWVKMDAHRVVRDYAWYWGDFFFLLRSSLVFNGVFELAPHPMYSVGYAGYYGMSLLTGSYAVLFASILAHAAQFGFLLFVENPHIERTYGTDINHARLSPRGEDNEFELPPEHDLVGFVNFDFTRISDVALLIIALYSIFIILLSSNSHYSQFWAIFQAFVWRFLHSIIHAFILFYQSKSKAWTKHFIRNGESAAYAWSQWKGLYNLTLNMSYISFVMAAWKLYHLPSNWTYGLVSLRHALGFGLIALHIYTSVSIYEDLGQYGWFYGDFFLPSRSPKLVYQGIYRYVNNPERFLGCSAYWGLALISSSAWIFLIAILAQLSNLAIIRLVEQPHMQKVYGNTLRKEAGISKLIKQATSEKGNILPKTVETHMKALTTSVDKVLDQTAEALEEFVNTAPPKVQELLKGTESNLRKNAQLAILKLFAPQLSSSTHFDYKLEIKGIDNNQVLLGHPITVCWTASPNHEINDWIGLYKLSDNASDLYTQTSSEGRWSAIDANGYTSHCSSIKSLSNDKNSGEVEFSGDLLFWETGTFEFRYHYGGKHLVMAKTEPFVITATSMNTTDVDEVSAYLLKSIKFCDPNITPHDGDASLCDISEGSARKLTSIIKYSFGIDLSYRVVQVDGSCSALSRRIVNSLKILQSFDGPSGAKDD
ncbi:phosphatidylethanolamine N-methyltransferase Cho2 [Schizosaccharomyces pombe]|uniref:Phosphatidylethanolamine N-methyltransferase n=1 Tax=Schizosaccharomyces pombe (strain 972 / ATCC 24843) TaxID=284812 RepID=CHO2_SCHPO|nr:phosphatidylethanolamine N-methyltransferase Cho2 [Schizosaccharomyces pombe]O74787.1 RecName: Full=Phosphatidylethanolamine N-methyltransferase; Short=PE methyltransferase; Short=PEAMT; Short=PEMT [Schizosaccharomyces pombe 972h-]CAA21095.1 phosphatidylethanolamine N-methyltransferase Cho2 [Schizosaccharomyces pombe]|eukprot:NP_596644.1 phosphatidylethanolamine N-methyltransferase Cho2 [Schizosaccharomyces pombe]